MKSRQKTFILKKIKRNEKRRSKKTHERKQKHTKYSNRNNRIIFRQYSSNTVQFEHELLKKNTHREHDKYINTICMLFFMCFIWLAVAALFFFFRLLLLFNRFRVSQSFICTTLLNDQNHTASTGNYTICWYRRNRPVCVESITVA